MMKFGVTAHELCRSYWVVKRQRSHNHLFGDGWLEHSFCRKCVDLGVVGEEQKAAVVGTTCLQRLEDDVKALLNRVKMARWMSKWISGVLCTGFRGRAKAW